MHLPQNPALQLRLYCCFPIQPFMYVKNCFLSHIDANCAVLGEISLKFRCPVLSSASIYRYGKQASSYIVADRLACVVLKDHYSAESCLLYLLVYFGYSD